MHEQLVKLLQAQIGNEERAARIYRQMGYLCKNHNLLGAAAFFEGHAQEEYEHMIMFAEYLYERDQEVVFSAQEATIMQYKSLVGLVEKALEHEREVTAQILEIHKLCDEVRDVSAQIFIDGFVAEQQEEEALFKKLLGRLKLVGDDTRALWYQDQEMQQAHQRKNAAS